MPRLAPIKDKGQHPCDDIKHSIILQPGYTLQRYFPNDFMEIISVPSPSAFLRSPVPQPPVPPIKSKSVSKKRLAYSIEEKTKGATLDGTVKPKQSKSRNGCVTCKAKRLKCDETKPTCQQCHKRNVECGGYKKDFKWRAFEEATFTSKPIGSRLRKATAVDKPEEQSPESPTGSDGSNSTIIPPFPQPSQYLPAVQFSPVAGHTQFSHPYFPPVSKDWNSAPQVSSSDDIQLVQGQRVYDGTVRLDSTPNTLETGFDEHATVQAAPTTASSFSSGQSPRLIDLLLPGTDLNAAPTDYMDYRPQPSDITHRPGSYIPSQEEEYDPDEGIEEIVRQPDPSTGAWVMRLPSPSPSSSSGSSSSSDSIGFNLSNYVYNQPKLHPASAEMLMLNFDTQTCGILSVKDGLHENPWRTLVWPLAQDSPALYHAISSMTAFHSSKLRPIMKVEGMYHIEKSFEYLRRGIQDMSIEAALATTLALAFSESWDIHVSTGIKHLRGAKVLVNKAMTKHRQNALSAGELVRLKFLYNTWIYMDVIARLTNVDEDVADDFETTPWPSFEPFSTTEGTVNEVDPLMGCASTLFPLIGRVANLVRKVRKSKSNSINIISQANELKTLVELWKPPMLFEQPEDPTSGIQDSLQTAEAYRWATLLYLHQAVPEIPSQCAAQLAKKVLVYLATVPISSRLIIVQIYPLLAAGCEAESADDRLWVEQRWIMMTQRMLIGNIDRCLEVVKEVWDRRDAYETERLQWQNRRVVSRIVPYLGSPMQNAKRAFGSEEAVDAEFFDWGDQFGSAKRRATEGGWGMPTPSRVQRGSKGAADGLESVEYERTVRGRLHWVGVMKDWKWEVLLG